MPEAADEPRYRTGLPGLAYGRIRRSSAYLDKPLKPAITIVFNYSGRERLDMTPFHLALPIRGTEEMRHFGGETPGHAMACYTGDWTDFDHLSDSLTGHVRSAARAVPQGSGWKASAATIDAAAGLDCIFKLTRRFESKPGEHAMLTLHNPSGGLRWPNR